MKIRLSNFRAAIEKANDVFNRDMLRRVLTLVLCMLMTMQAMVFTAPDSTADPVVYTEPYKISSIDAGVETSGYNPFAWYDAAAGTQADPFVITNGLELAALASIVNGTALATANIQQNSFTGQYISLVGSACASSTNGNVIDLIANGGLLYQSNESTIGFAPCDNLGIGTGWTPIGADAEHPFNGIVTGASYASVENGAVDSVDVYNLSAIVSDGSDFGLFGYLGASARISGLHLKDTQYYIVSGNTSSVGSVAAVMCEGAQITNCSVMGLDTNVASGTLDDARTTDRMGRAVSARVVGSTSTIYDLGYYFVPQFTIRSELSTDAVGGLVGRITEAPAAQGSVQPQSEPQRTPGADAAARQAEVPTQTEAVTIAEEGTEALAQTEATETTQPVEATEEPDTTTEEPQDTEAVTASAPEEETEPETVSEMPPDAVMRAAMLAEQNAATMMAIPNGYTGAVISGCSFYGTIFAMTNSTDSGVIATAVARKNGTGGIVGSIVADTMLDELRVGGIDGKSSLQMYVCGWGIGGFVGFAGDSHDVTISAVTGGVEFYDYFKVNETATRMYTMTGGVLGASFVTGTLSVMNVGASATEPYSVKMHQYTNAGSGATDNLSAGLGGVIGYVTNRSTTMTAVAGATSAIDGGFLTIEASICCGVAQNNFYFGGVIGRCFYNNAQYSTATLTVEDITVQDSVFKSDDDTVNYPDYAQARLSVGGMIGGITLEKAQYNISAASYLRNCTINGFDFSTGGLAGGLIGTSHSGYGCAMPLVDGCKIFDVRFFGLANSTFTKYFKIGGIAPHLYNSTIQNCEVENLEVWNIANDSEALYSWVGGLVGRSSGCTFTGNTVNAKFRLSSSNRVGNSYFVGGIAGYADTQSGQTTVTNCAVMMDYDYPTTYTNNIETTPVVATLVEPGRGVIVGGLFGETYSAVSITDSFSTGIIDATYANAISSSQSLIGGIAGLVSTGCDLTLTDSFSTMSLKSNMQDAEGGLFGFNGSSTVTCNTSWFGGHVMDPWGGSIAGYSNGIISAGLTYNQKMTPNAPSAEGKITATNAATFQPATAPVCATNAMFDDYLAFCQLPLATFSGANNATDHVFAVASGDTVTPLAAGTGYGVTASSAAFTLSGSEAKTVTYDITYTDELGHTRHIFRQAKFIGVLSGKNGSNGLSGTPFTLTSASDFTNMQTYVAAGGGFLGAQYRLGATVSIALNAPIGMANSDLILASETDLPFCGSFDGQRDSGYTLTVTSLGSGKPFNGLFGYARTAQFTDLNLFYSPSAQVAINTTADSTAGATSAGGLIGYADYCSIDNVDVETDYQVITDGTVTTTGITSNAARFGGIAGTVKSVSFNANADTDICSFVGSMKGGNNVGGIVGMFLSSVPTFDYNTETGTTGGTITATGNIYHTGPVSSNSYNNASVKRCYTTGDIISDNADDTAENVGGIVGYLSGGSGSVNSCFMYGNVYGNRFAGGLVGTAAKLSATTYNLVLTSYMSGDVYADNYAGGIVGYVAESMPTVSLAVSTYFVGQINCDNVYGALTSSAVGESGFGYDKQVSGDIGITGNGTYTPVVNQALTGNELRSLAIGGYVSATSTGYLPATTINANSFYDSTKIGSGNAREDYTYADPNFGMTTLNFAPHAYSMASDTNSNNANWFIVNSNSRFVIKPTNSTKITNGTNAAADGVLTDPERQSSYSVQFVFNGTDFVLNDYLSGGAHMFDVYIDGVLVDWTDAGFQQTGVPAIPDADATIYATGNTAALTSNVDWYRLQTENWTYYGGYLKNANPVSSAFPARASGSSGSVPEGSIYITGLSNAQHTVTLVSVTRVTTSKNGNTTYSVGNANNNANNQYFTFFGCSYWKRANTYTASAGESYPKLITFNATENEKAHTIATQSTEVLYDFTENGNNTATCFKYDAGQDPANTLTEKSADTVTYSHDATVIGAIGVTYANDVYTPPTLFGSGGEFIVTTNHDTELADVTDYHLNIKERIYVVPFSEGYGTATNPFRIPDVETLRDFRDFINTVYNGTGQYFKLTMQEDHPTYITSGGTFDYDLTGNTHGAGETESPWATPVGTIDTPFGGDFDGGGCRVTGLVLNATTAGGTGNTSVGLFGVTAGATIHDVSVVGQATRTVAADTTTMLNVGLVAGEAYDTVFRNVTADGNLTLTENAAASPLSAGILVGALIGDSTISNCLAHGDITITAAGNSGNNDRILRLGGLAGRVYTSKNNQSALGGVVTAKIENSVADVDISAAGSKRAITAGPVVGIADVTQDSELTIQNSCGYGSVLIPLGRVGGIAGAVFSGGNTKISLKDLTSTATLTHGGSGRAVDSYCGGIAGAMTGTSGSITVTGTTFGGKLLALGNSVYYNTGGISGSTTAYIAEATATALEGGATVNRYTKSENYGISDYGAGANYNRANDGTYEMLDANGLYPAVTLIGTATVGNATDATMAGQIIRGNSIPLNVVRTNPVKTSDNAVAASSVYVLPYPTGNAANGATLHTISATPPASVIYSISNRRAISTANEASTALLTVKVRQMDGATDLLGGYGKEFTYYPNIHSTGRSDASYAIADPDGDGIETGNADVSYAIYNEDQLMGLDAVVTGSDHDGVGGFVMDSIVDDDYSIYMQKDISFGDTSNYIDASAYTDFVIGNGAAPFTGVLDGKHHLITERQLSTHDADAGLFAAASGATFRYIGFTDSVYRQRRVLYTITATSQKNFSASAVYYYRDDTRNYRILPSITSENFAAVLKTRGTLYTLRLTPQIAPAAGTTGYYNNEVNGDYLYVTYVADDAHIGGIAGNAADSTVTDCFSSVRVEQDQPANSETVCIGGFFGTTTGTCTVSGSAFTGSVGIETNSISAYPSFTGTTPMYSGALVGHCAGSMTVSDGSYVASYVDGAQNTANQQYIGQYAGYAATAPTVTGSTIDYSAGASDCYLAGNFPNQTTAFTTVTGGLYPLTDGFSSSDVRVATARIAVDFSSAAYSISKAELTYGTAVFSQGSYRDCPAVYDGGTAGSTVDDKYLMSDGDRTLTRNNNGIASVVVVNGTSARLIMMNLKCWYDDYATVNGEKIYTIKNASELVEFAQFVNAMSFADFQSSDLFDATLAAGTAKAQYDTYVSELIGHGHSTNTDQAQNVYDAFANAEIRLGADITIGTDIEELFVIGENRAFAGTFNGNGYLLSFAQRFDEETETNLPIITSDSDHIGLFGNIAAGATIENVVLSGDMVISSTATSGTVYVGVIAGENNGTITACANSAALKIQTNGATVLAGGIVGENKSGVTLSDCYNMGHLTSDLTTVGVAGIAGANAGTLQYCYNTGILEGCLDGSPMYGIAAANTGTVTACYNAGVFYNNAADAYGAIAPGTVSSCYFDKQVFVSNYADSTVFAGTTAATTALLTSGIANLSLGDASHWANAASGSFYPQLSCFAGHTEELQRGASLASALSATLTDKGATGYFDGFTGITFTFGTSGVTPVLQPESTGTFIFTDTATAKSGVVNQKGTAFFHHIYTTADGTTVFRETYFINEAFFTVRYMFDYSVLVADATETTLRTESYTGNTFDGAGNSYGTGSANKPYLINTAADFMNFVTFVNNGGATSNKYFKLVSDITVPAGFVPIGTAAHPFAGNFNGNGHVISGINYTQVASNGYVGLFGKATDTSIIRFVGLENCNFYTLTDANIDTYTGAIAGMSDGEITDCYSRAIVHCSNTAAGKTLCAGSLVGALGENAVMQGCYARPVSQTGETAQIPDAGMSNTFNSSVNRASVNFYGGILVGKNQGRINGCYHTSGYYEPSGIANLLPHGALVGWNCGGTVLNTFFNTTLINNTSNIFVYTNTGTAADPASGDASDASFLLYGKSNTQMRCTEGAASVPDENSPLYVANDSMALDLGEDLCLGTYEMSLLTPPAGITRTSTYSNDGYPMLTAFDLFQFEFASFDATNLILNLQNIDASSANVKIMNALCSYENYDFPIFAPFIAKSRINVNVFALPRNISFNVSAVGYGADDAGNEIKWVAYDGVYTNTRGFAGSLNPDFPYLAGHGGGMESNLLRSGKTTFVTASVEGMVLPTNCERIYVYITLNKDADAQTRTWGVYHDWDSAYMDESMYEEET